MPKKSAVSSTDFGARYGDVAVTHSRVFLCVESQLLPRCRALGLVLSNVIGDRAYMLLEHIAIDDIFLYASKPRKSVIVCCCKPYHEKLYLLASDCV